MADGIDKPIMPKEDKQKLPEAIPVDDKGQPLPDPSENLSGYIVTSGVEHLKKTFASVETDDGVRETMEPPQQTGFFKKHRSGSRGYDYYGTPASSIPKDANGTEPSHLSKLFSEAEALEDSEEDKPVVTPTPIKQGKVSTPKQNTSTPVTSGDPKDVFERAGYTVLEDSVNAFKLADARRDDDTPRLRDMYKTNTKVIFQSEADAKVNGSKVENYTPEAEELFAEPGKLTKAKSKIHKKELKAQIRLEKQKAKAKKKADKALRKLQLKAEKLKSKPLNEKTRSKLTAIEEKIASMINLPVITVTDSKTQKHLESVQKSNEQKKKAEKEAKLAVEKAQVEKAKAEQEAKLAAEKAQTEKEEAEKAVLEAQQAKSDAENLAKEAFQKAKEQSEEAAKIIELAKQQKESAQRAAQLAAQEANRKLLEEKERIRLAQQEEERALAQKRAENQQEIESQKAAAQQARLDAEKLKAELEEMRQAAALALAQKQEAEEATRIAREEKARLDAEAAARAEAERIRQEELAAKRAARKAREEVRKAETEKIRQERDEAIAKAKAEKEAAIAKAKADRDAAIAKAKAEKEAAIAKIHQSHKKDEDSSKDVPITKPVNTDLKIDKNKMISNSTEE